MKQNQVTVACLILPAKETAARQLQRGYQASVHGYRRAQAGEVVEFLALYFGESPGTQSFDQIGNGSGGGLGSIRPAGKGGHQIRVAQFGPFMEGQLAEFHLCFNVGKRLKVVPLMFQSSTIGSGWKAGVLVR